MSLEDLHLNIEVTLNNVLVCKEVLSSIDKAIQYYNKEIKGVTVKASYTGESGIVFPSELDMQADKFIIANKDTVTPPVWARSVQESFYREYCVLPLSIHDLLHTPYSGHDWGLIHQSLLTDSSVQLLDSIEVWVSSTTIDIRTSYDDITLDHNVYLMICMLNDTHNLHKVVKITDASRRIFYTFEEYYTANNAAADFLPPLLTEE